ncbi:MAG: iron ABC transporter substrate-binding protein [Planctomycetes bacterium]|jgi:iron(III) transport system substrate-binding protein|nr:iron ABC transporter substrate-binding protein [Planctomycetota bacterium]MDP6409062.1 extracellular solute-binding protein [Planctomycetota bacterium]
MKRARPPHRSRPALVGLALSAAACAPEPDIILYCALDEVHAAPIVRTFEERSGLSVRAEYDIEAHKTVGLVRRIREERNRPRCDVFWNNEIAHTVSLADDGLLAAYDSPSAADIPEEFRDPQRRWTGFAARARVLIVNTDLADPAQIGGMWDLVDPRWRGQCGMARPLTGTTLTHATALFSVLGEERALEYLTGVKQGDVHLTSGNATLMRLVSAGEFAWGWTDTDDFNVALDRGAPVAAVFPDAGPDGVGTLLIPNTVCVLAQAPHPDAARRLVDFVLSAEVEETLARSRSAQIPLHASLTDLEHPLPLERMKVMQVDYARVGAEIDERHGQLKEMFLD